MKRKLDQYSTHQETGLHFYKFVPMETTKWSKKRMIENQVEE